MKKYDVVIIGSGPGGVNARKMLSRADKSVCIIEKSEFTFGGACINNGCMPTKALVKSAQIVEMAQNSHMFGVEIPKVIPNMKTISGILDNTSEMLREMQLNDKISDVIIGHGRFIDSNQIEISKSDGSKEIIYGEEIVIATGSRPRLLPTIPVDGKHIWSSDDILKNDAIPNSLLVIGGGVIGCEFASIYSRFGTKVTIAEMSDNILPNEDIDTCLMVKELFSEKGIKVYTTTSVKDVEIVDNQVKCYFEGKHIEEQIFDKVLLSIGRTPNIDELNLEKAGVEVENGFIKVNEYLQTTKENVYALGDVIPTAMLAHTAAYESLIVSNNIKNKKSKKYEDFTTPRVVFSNPEVASVGLTEKQAKEKYEIKVIELPNFMNGKAVVDKATEGRVKIIVNKENEVVVGANIIGEHATELIHEWALAVRNNLTVSDIRDTIHAHPTLAESIWYATLHS